VIHPARAATALFLGTVNQLLPVAAVWLLAGELRVSLPLVDIALVTFVASLAATLPISFAGWGVREGALVFLFGLYDVEPQTAFTISILFGASLTISSTPGAFMLLRGQTQLTSGQGDSQRSDHI
jgi:uncharacterized membrane protein YbhN (UPF0104 family)